MNAIVDSPERLALDGYYSQPPQLVMDTIIADRFAIRGMLGRGGQGIVYHSYDMDTGLNVAIKTPVIADEYDLGRANREVELTEALSRCSEGIVPFVAAGVSADNGEPFVWIGTEQMAGDTLDRKIRTEGAAEISIGGLAKILGPALHGAVVAHKAGVVHRDIKPANIFIDKNGGGRLGDFGIAVAESLDIASFRAYHISPDALLESYTSTNIETPCTPGYAPPEALKGNAFTRAGDVYSAGVVLLKCLAGREPGATTTIPRELSTNIAPTCDARQTRPIARRKCNKKIPPDLNKIARSCVEKDPKDRPQMLEVARAVAEYA